MTERELQEAIRALCRDLRLVAQHYEDSRRCWVTGWPDLEIIGTRTLYRELKSARGDLTPEQRQVGYQVQAAGGDWAVWRPADLLSGRITRELTAISRLGAKT